MRISSRRGAVALSALALLAFGSLAAPARADILSDANTVDASQYAVLFEGGGTHNQFQTNNFNITGQIGIGGNGGYSEAGGGNPANVISSTGQYNVEVAMTAAAAAAAGSTFTSSGQDTYKQFAGSASQTTSSSPAYNFGATQVQTDLNNLNNFSAAFAGTGKALTISIGNGATQTVNVSDGTAVTETVNGKTVTEQVFNVGSFSTVNGSTLTINGDGSQNVIFNFANSANFNGTIKLTGGITSDQVLFNFTGGANLTGGPTVQGVTNMATLTGIFLDPNGTMSANNTNIAGRFFGGDSSNLQLVSGGSISAPGGGTITLLSTVPEPSSGVVAAFVGLIAVGWAGVRRVRNRSARPSAV